MNKPIKFVVWFPIVLVAAFAAGYLFLVKMQEPEPYDMEPISVVRNHRTAPVSTDIAGWQTYRNEKCGFEIKYPQGWLAQEQTDTTGCFISFSNGADLKNIYLESTADSKRISYIREGEVGSGIRLADKTWETFLHRENNPGEYGDFRTTLALLADYSGKKFIIRLTPSNDFGLNDSEFNQILSTFKFLTTETQNGIGR